MNRRKGKQYTAVKVLLILLAAAVVGYIGLTGYVCIREGKVSSEVPEASDYDAIIVLGAQVLPDGAPNVQLSWRLDKAYEAWKVHPVPVVVCGAQGADEPCPEAEAMAAYLVDLGIPEDQILKDPDSFNTNQNLKNAAALLHEHPDIKRVLIVTSDYHVPRAMSIARDLGFEADGIGSPCKPEYWLKNHSREALAWVKYFLVKYLHVPLS